MKAPRLQLSLTPSLVVPPWWSARIFFFQMEQKDTDLTTVAATPLHQPLEAEKWRPSSIDGSLVDCQQTCRALGADKWMMDLLSRPLSVASQPKVDNTIQLSPFRLACLRLTLSAALSASAGGIRKCQEILNLQPARLLLYPLLFIRNGNRLFNGTLSK